MPERVTREEKLVELAIEKAKTVIAEAEHLGTIENKEDVNGETVKVKRPNKNPPEKKLPNTSNIDGKADLVNEG